MEHIQEILIPKSRIAVLIGEKGGDRRFIERAGEVKLEIDSKEGLVTIKSEDALNLWIATRVIEAVGRGFSPQDAALLFKEGYSFEKIDLRDFRARTKKRQQTLKARVIGTKGKAKNVIQQYTNTLISIQGKTICILGKTEDVMLAHQAIGRILEGSRQGTAFKFLREKYKSH